MYFSLLLLFLLIVNSQPATLPSQFKKCSVKDANFNQCLAVSVEDAIHKLSTGVVGFNMPPIDPIKIPSMTIPSGTGPVNVEQHYKDVELYGNSELTVTKFEANLQMKTFDFETFSKNMTFKANYDLNGRVLLLPVSGNGPVTLILENMRLTNHVQFEEVERKGKKYFKAVDFKVKMYPKKVTYNFENLFNGDRTLGDAMNKILNDNDLTIFDDVKQGYENSFDIVFKELVNRVFTRIPLEEIFVY